jgi:hypothetical protein
MTVVGGVDLVHPELAAQVGGQRRDEPGAGAGADQHGADLLRLPSRLVQCGLGRLQGELLQRERAVLALLDAGLRRDLLGAHRRPVVGRVADQVVVGAHLVAVHRGQGLDPRLHREALPHVELGVGPHRRPGLPGAGDVPGLGAGAQPAQEAPHLLVPRVEGDHVVVVLEVLGPGQLHLRPVPGVLVVQHHRPAVQRLELRDVLGDVEDVGVVVDRVVRVVARQPEGERARLLQELRHRGLDRRQRRGVVLPVAVDVEQDVEDPVLAALVPPRRQLRVGLLHRGDLGLAVLPRLQHREEDVRARPGDVGPAGGPLVVHGDREAVGPEQVQGHVPHQVVAGGVGAGAHPLQDLGAARGLGLEVPADDAVELLERLEGGEVQLRHDVRGEHHAAVLVQDEGVHEGPLGRAVSSGRCAPSPARRRR